LPPSGTAIDRTSPTLPRLMHVQKVSRAACPLLGTMVPSKLPRNAEASIYNAVQCCTNHRFILNKNTAQIVNRSTAETLKKVTKQQIIDAIFFK
jgi:hypothetical protein